MQPMNPYWNADFTQTLCLLLKRAFLFFCGKISLDGLVEDDIAFFALSLVGVSSVLSGAFLVVKRTTLMINSLSHTILLGIVVTALLLISQGFSPFSTFGFLIAAFFTSCVTIWSTNTLVKVFRVQQEAAVGFMFTSLFGLGVLFSTLFFRNTHLGLEAIFGNLDALVVKDLPPLLAIMVINVLWVVLAFGRLRTLAFDPIFSSIVGLKGALIQSFHLFLTALTIVGGFQSVGVVIIMAYFCLPVLIAKLFYPSLKKILFLGSVIIGFVSLISVALTRDILTYHQVPVSTGATAALLLFIIYMGVGLTFLKKGAKLEHL